MNVLGDVDRGEAVWQVLWNWPLSSWHLRWRRAWPDHSRWVDGKRHVVFHWWRFGPLEIRRLQSSAELAGQWK